MCKFLYKLFFLKATIIFIISPSGLYSQPIKSKSSNGSSVLKVMNNPIIPNLGVCDPHIHIFNNKAYLFASHDREPTDSFYGMYDWWIWSSSNLVNWQMEFNLFPKDMWVGATNNAWAVDGASRNGKYYFYVSGNWKTGVAVSNDGPGGPYKDALKKSIPGIKYDPTVFIDDDINKTPYLITGSFPYQIAKLNDDMISLAEKPTDITHTSVAWKGDGSFIHKRNGIYYLNGHGTDYSTATNIYGPYTYRGKFYSKWIDHPTIFSWNNQTYCAFGMGDVGKFFRKTHLTYVHYKDNGDIVSDANVGNCFVGVGQYDCSKKIEAEWYFAASDQTKKQEVDSGFVVKNITNKASLYYPRILNVAANANLNMHVSSESSGGTLEIRLNTIDGKIIGKINIPNTGSLSTYKTISTKLNNKEGLNNIYFLYKGKAGNSLNIDWFSMPSTGVIQQPTKGQPIIVAAQPNATTQPVNAFNQIEAEDLICYNVLRTGDGNDNGPVRYISNMKNKSYASYMIDFGTTVRDSLTFEARLSAVIPGSIEILLDSITGPSIGTCDYSSTKSINDYVTNNYKVKAPTGVKHLFLVFRMQEKGKYHNSAPTINLNWIKFK